MLKIGHDLSDVKALQQTSVDDEESKVAQQQSPSKLGRPGFGFPHGGNADDGIFFEVQPLVKAQAFYID